ncbi:polysaccharide deacetylase family protein [Marinifilum sp. D737]|uniref:polysaccharide deacetylase family protein n=1 Tax=Marinifilum sp. D737 TaxID=2969628 RepID=UPI0022739593|nr:polysaccharide deacetylase family protein [Marinifilum sp. D737]MCY1635010.1 polysaccharide deacetylase family protein [Marinifilum sp. D737]
MKKLLIFLIKNVLGSFLFFFGGVHIIKYLLRKKRYYIVLNYHNFSRYNNYKINRGDILEIGYERNFEKQVCFLKKHFQFCYPEEFYCKNTARGIINILLTFDDGYKDNYDIAYPILKKYKIPAVFFIVSSVPNTNSWLWHDKVRFLVTKNKLDAIEAEKELVKLNAGKKMNSKFIEKIDELSKEFPDKRLMMNWNEIKELAENGYVIGSHTHTHSPILFLNSINRKKELQSSIKIISEKINKTVSQFAYPNGLYDNDCDELMFESGIKISYTTDKGFNQKNDSFLRIKRIGVNASDSIGVLLLKLFLNKDK